MFSFAKDKTFVRFAFLAEMSGELNCCSNNAIPFWLIVIHVDESEAQKQSCKQQWVGKHNRSIAKILL